MNLVKSKDRTSLTIESTDALIRLRTEGSKAHTFDVTKVTKRYLEMGHKRCDDQNV